MGVFVPEDPYCGASVVAGRYMTRTRMTTMACGRRGETSARVSDDVKPWNE